MIKKIYMGMYNSPVGVIKIEADETKIISIKFSNKKDHVFKEEKNDIIEKLICQLNGYFNGELKIFSIALKLEGTEFQKKIWSALKKIPYGQTVSYKDIAIATGNVKSVRAIGNANGKNRFPIIIPCHRVIYENRTIGGFSAGIWRKKYLLNLEKKNI